MRKYLLPFFLVIFLFAGCTKYKLEPDTPPCLKDELKKFSNSGSDEANIKEYEFQNKLLYVYNDGIKARDDGWPVYDSNCNIIDYLGGMAGNTKINKEEFSNAKLKRIVWRSNQ